jgi:hypothetical protein
MDSEEVKKTWLIGLCAVILVAATVGAYAYFGGGGATESPNPKFKESRLPPPEKKAS